MILALIYIVLWLCLAATIYLAYPRAIKIFSDFGVELNSLFIIWADVARTLAPKTFLLILVNLWLNSFGTFGPPLVAFMLWVSNAQQLSRLAMHVSVAGVFLLLASMWGAIILIGSKLMNELSGCYEPMTTLPV